MCNPWNLFYYYPYRIKELWRSFTSKLLFPFSLFIQMDFLQSGSYSSIKAWNTISPTEAKSYLCALLVFKFVVLRNSKKFIKMQEGLSSKICCFFESLPVNCFTFFHPAFCGQMFKLAANLGTYWVNDPDWKKSLLILFSACTKWSSFFFIIFLAPPFLLSSKLPFRQGLCSRRVEPEPFTNFLFRKWIVLLTTIK